MSMNKQINEVNPKWPVHVGIILDGNRRFAKRLMLEPWKGHEYGKEKLKKLFEWCKEFGVRELTLYCFSMQNFNRPKKEFDYLMKIFIDAAKEALEDKRVRENKIRIRVIGRKHLLPKEVQLALARLEEATKDYDGYLINLAIAYGGREEIIDGIKKLAKDVQQGNVKVDDINEDVFKNYLYLADEPDMIIRTGGEQRTSNFLPWQSIYSEWIFLKKTWPEFEKEDFEWCLDEYARRERRFGR